MKAGAAYLRKVLRSESRRKCRYVITGDETWLVLNYSSSSRWIPIREPPPTVPKFIISSKKNHAHCLLLWSWSSSWVLIQTAPQDEFTLLHRNCLEAIKRNGKPGKLVPKNRYLLYFDNVPPHRCRPADTFLDSTCFRPLIPPSYNPDLAPSDFFLFGFLKGRLKR
jgi:hypothetical protein